MFTIAMCLITVAVCAIGVWMVVGGMFSKDASRTLTAVLLFIATTLIVFGALGMTWAFVVGGLLGLLAVFAGLVSLGGE